MYNYFLPPGTVILPKGKGCFTTFDAESGLDLVGNQLKEI